MNGWNLTTSHLDYAQRTGWIPANLSECSFSSAPPERRHEVRVLAIGREEKKPVQVTTEAWRLVSDDLTPGLYGQRVPVAFHVCGDASGLQVRVGTWSSRPDAGPDLVPRRAAVLEGVLGALYPQVQLLRSASVPTAWSAAGLALGVPTAKRPQDGDPSAPLDRIVRAMQGSDWSLLVLAHPVNETRIAALRDAVLNEARQLKEVTAAAGAPSPLADAYETLLTASLKSLNEGMSTGAWRTCVYLMGDDRSYPLLAGLWRSIFSGEASTPEPIRVWDRPEVAGFAQHWAMPDAAGRPGPGHYRQPYEFQTLLTSHQLATLVHLPDLEKPGFAVNLVTRWDAVPAQRNTAGQGSVRVGFVVSDDKATDALYEVTHPSLSRHAFVAGVTGSGKTNTIFHLLEQLTPGRVPFLVIEPSKTEYRSLLDTPGIGERLHVFTVGNEQVTPLRLNPFEFAAGTPVSVHLDLLRSLFTASFGMWNPLPQILEQSLYRIYQQRGWDIATGGNDRLDPSGVVAPMAYPTLADLYEEVEDTIAALGYSDEVTSNMRAALSTRIGALLIGGKGRLLDTPLSTPDRVLFDESVVLELEPMGDDDDKAFVMGLVLIRLAELARSRGQSGSLRHIVVVEEAHRLLANVGAATDSEEGNPRAKAVETFVNLLAEVRAYGEGIIVADQTPVKLAPELIKSTNLKVAHRLVAEDDRVALGTTMAMSEPQMRGMATIRTGRAAVFSEGDDAPLLVEVPQRKRSTQAWPDGNRVADHMRQVSPQPVDPMSSAWMRHRSGSCDEPARACRLAREIAADADFRVMFARVVQSLLEDPSSMARLWGDVQGSVNQRLSPAVDEAATLRCLVARATAWLAERRGRQRGWSYPDTDTFGQAVHDALTAAVTGADTATSSELLPVVVERLFRRDRDPYAACSHICADRPNVCLYRNAAADILERDGDPDEWMATAGAGDLETASHSLWLAAADAGERIIEYPEQEWPDGDAERSAAAGIRASLCIAQQAMHRGMRDEPAAARRATLAIIAAAQHEPDQEEPDETDWQGTL